MADYIASRPLMTKEITIIEEIQLYKSTYYNMLLIAAQYNPFIAIVVSTVIRYFSEKQQFSLQELKEEKTRAELELLKSQVNPHFFFNTLNTLFSMASIKGDEETAEGISKLSELMRYMIYETKVEKIALEKEIEYIKNFIELQKLRFSKDDDLDVSFEITGETSSKFIPPMLFIPFIENAFKFGFSIKQKSVIQIRLNVDKAHLTFRVKNTINKKKAESDEHSGIGISNVKKRLELLYPDSFDLKITKDEEYFDVNLNIPI